MTRNLIMTRIKRQQKNSSGYKQSAGFFVSIDFKSNAIQLIYKILRILSYVYYITITEPTCITLQ